MRGLSPAWPSSSSCFHAACSPPCGRPFPREQAGERSAKKAQRAEARGVARKVLKLLGGPALAGAPQLLPRVLPLVLSALLVSPACGRKVVATAVKVARGLGSPLLAGLEGLQLPRDEAEGQQEETAGKGGKGKAAGKKAAAEAARDAAQAAAAAERRKAAAEAAYNARVVAALGAQAASSPAAAAEICQALEGTGSGEPGAAAARPLLLMAAHAAVHAGGEGATVVAAALLRQLRAPAGAFQPAEPLPKECFDASGVPTPAFLARGGHSADALLSSALLAALRQAPWQALAPHGTTVRPACALCSLFPDWAPCGSRQTGLVCPHACHRRPGVPSHLPPSRDPPSPCCPPSCWLQDALGLLRALCSLRWQPALSALLARLAGQQLDPLRLLSELYAAPPAAEAAATQLEAVERATALLLDRLAAGRPGSAGGKKQGGGVGVAELGRALCVLCHPDRELRRAGVALAHACAHLLQAEELSGVCSNASLACCVLSCLLQTASCGTPPGCLRCPAQHPGLPAHPSRHPPPPRALNLHAPLLASRVAAARAQKQLASALSGQAELLAADPEGLQRLVEALLGAGEEPAGALAGCALAPGDAAGLGGALLAAAEEQAGAAATAGRNAAAAATAAYSARLLLGLAAEWAPPAQLLGVASRLMASGGRMRGAAPSSPEAEQKDALLVAAAGCFTAPRLEAVAQQAAGSEAAAALGAWCRLLDPSSRLPAAARLALLRQVQERFFCLLPADVQGRCLKVGPRLRLPGPCACLPTMPLLCAGHAALTTSRKEAEADSSCAMCKLHPGLWPKLGTCLTRIHRRCGAPTMQALLRAASKDGDEGCRAAARAALAAMPLRAATLLPLLSLEPGAAGAGADEEMLEAEPAAEAEEEQDEELARLLAEAEAAAAAAKQGTPRSKQKRGGKPGKDATAAEASAAAAAEAVQRRRQQLAEQRLARQQGRAAATRGRGGAGAAAAAAAATSECCIAVLELLQWKENVQGVEELAPAVQAVLSRLLADLAAGSGEQGEDGGQASADELAAVPGMAAAETVYAVQLCLAALTGMARSVRRGAPPTPAQAPALPTPAGKGRGKGRGRQAPAALPVEGLQGFDLALAVRAARQAPDGAVRNAALQLVAELALGMPEVRPG